MSAAQRFVLIGHPLGHTLSPVIHQAAYDALGLPHSYQAVACPEEADALRQIERVRSGEVRGLNVTVPYKRLALARADRLDDSAREVGAANVLCRDEAGQLVAYNTDALALADELGKAAQGRGALVIGNGGAALAAVVAARHAGAAPVGVIARRFSADLPAAQWPMADELRAAGAEPMAWVGAAAGTAQLLQLASTVAFVIQATSAGMKGADSGTAVAQAVPWAELPTDAFAYDLVYNPARTAFTEQAARHGLRASTGLGMLVGQAARAFSLWLGLPAPIAAMRSAAQRALFGGNS